MKVNIKINIRITSELKESALLVIKQVVLSSWEGRDWIKDDFNKSIDENGCFSSNVDYNKPVIQTPTRTRIFIKRGAEKMKKHLSIFLAAVIMIGIFQSAGLAAAKTMQVKSVKITLASLTLAIGVKAITYGGN